MVIVRDFDIWKSINISPVRALSTVLLAGIAFASDSAKAQFDSPPLARTPVAIDFGRTDITAIGGTWRDETLPSERCAELESPGDDARRDAAAFLPGFSGELIGGRSKETAVWTDVAPVFGLYTWRPALGKTAPHAKDARIGVANGIQASGDRSDARCNGASRAYTPPADISIRRGGHIAPDRTASDH